MSAGSRDLHRARARARFRFERGRDGRSYLARQAAGYPFHVTRAFHLPSDPQGMSTLYLQSVSGGLYRDDLLELAIEAGPNAAAHVTTGAFTIVHATAPGQAAQSVRLTAEAGALLEYLPDPLVLFPRARLESTTHVRLAPGATVLLAESFLSHDPQGREAPFELLALTLRAERPDGSLLFLDRIELEGAALAHRGRDGERLAAHGAFVCLHSAEEPGTLAAALHEAVAAEPHTYAGASTLPAGAGAFARVLAADSLALRRALDAAWRAARRSLFGRDPEPRRK